MSKIEQIIRIFLSMSVVELRDFVRRFNLDKHGIEELFISFNNLEPVGNQLFNERSRTGMFRVTIYEQGMNGKFIQSIKLYRELYGKGLKESKDWCDAVRNSNQGVIIDWVPMYIAQAINNHWLQEGISTSIEPM